MIKNEWDFVLWVIQEAAKAAYMKRDEEVKAGKPANPEQFAVSAKHRLTLEKELKKFSTNR